MQAFKAFFKLLLANRTYVITYFAIFLAMVVILSGMESSDGEAGFTESRLDVAVIDNDHGEYSKIFTEYFSDSNNLSFIEDDREYILDSLYWRAMDYVLIIPEGFSESLLTENPLELNKLQVPGYFDAEFFESELSMFNQKLMTMTEAGYSMEEAGNELNKLKESSVEVKLASFVNANQNDKVKGMFNRIPYLFIAVGVSAIGLILLSFNRKEVKDRTECGPTTLRERNAGMIAAIVAFGLILVVVAMVLAVIFSGGKVFNDNRMPFFLINCICIMLFSLSIGFFAGNVAQAPEVMNGIVNVVSLLLCFMGGVFMPQELFSDGIRRVAQAAPTYWYVLNNELISSTVDYDSAFMKSMFTNCGIIVLAAGAVFAVTLVIINAKRKRSA